MTEKPILLTLGEPSGIGPDCTLLAWHSAPELFAGVCICAPPSWLRSRAALLGLDVSVREVGRPLASSGVLHCWNPGVGDGNDVVAGRPQPSTAPAVIACIEAAARACMQGTAAAIVTGPIEKAVLRDAGFIFPGHTEFLAHIAGVDAVVMMLASRKLRVALLTTHLALKDVAAELRGMDVRRSIRITDRGLKRFFALAHPCLALCALNPHGGERGHFGREEMEVLAPAVADARKEGIRVQGPLAADTLFAAGHRDAFDAIVCCYHDQALIPIKALDFGETVNVTLGLPFVRTSVDHGTALARAGSGKVSYSSLIEALKLAASMSREDANANK